MPIARSLLLLKLLLELLRFKSCTVLKVCVPPELVGSIAPTKPMALTLAALPKTDSTLMSAPVKVTPVGESVRLVDIAPPTTVEGDVLPVAICEDAMVMPAAKAGTVTVLCAKEISAGEVGVTFAIAVKVTEEPDPAAVARAVP